MLKFQIQIVMKKNIIDILLFISIYVIRFFDLFKLNWKNESSVLILPPADPGSLGDEAMVKVTIDNFIKRDVKRIGIISYGTTPQWTSFGKKNNNTEIYYYPVNFNNIKTSLVFLWIASRYERFYFIGADVLDGFYLEQETVKRLGFVALADRIKVKTTVLGFSFNKEPTTGSVKALTALSGNVRLCARDPVSRERLIRHAGRTAELVADLAFLLQPGGDSGFVFKISRWIKQEKSDGRIVLGINANYLFIEKIENKSIDKLIRIYINTINELYSENKNISIVLIPHDIRNYNGNKGDFYLAGTIYNALDKEIQLHCFTISELCTPAEIKFICKDLDIVLSGRMHLAIACLGQGTPVVSISYQDKFEGLYKHFGLDGMLIEQDAALQSGNLSGFLAANIERRNEIRRQIQLKLPDVLDLARKNFMD